jgi:hypothetical protein
MPPGQLIGKEEAAWTALLFGEAIETPFDDLDAIEAYDWPIAGRYGYPLPLQIGLSGRPTRPGKSDLLRLEATLLAIPRFVREHMRAHAEPPQPAEETLVILMADGEDRVHLRYPVPDLERGTEDQWPLAAETEVRELNAELLGTFEQWLHDQGLSARTIRRHLDNVETFAEHYLAEEGGSLELPCSADEAEPADVDEFLADWLLQRTDRALVGTVKSHIASLKKLYTCLKETGQIPAEDSDEILTLLREDRAYYLELAQAFVEGMQEG